MFTFKITRENEINLLKVLYVLVVLSSIAIVFTIALKTVNSSTKQIQSDFAERDQIIRKAIYGKKSAFVQIKKLQEQYAITETIKKSYFYIARKFNSYDFAFNIVFTFCSIISAMLAFLVVKKGWDNLKDFYLKSAFLIFFFSTSMFGVLPSVLNNKENAKNNLDKYNYYNGLQMDIYNLVKNNNHFLPDHPDSLDIHIANINVNIKQNQNLYFDMKTEGIPKDIKPTF